MDYDRYKSTTEGRIEKTLDGLAGAFPSKSKKQITLMALKFFAKHQGSSASVIAAEDLKSHQKKLGRYAKQPDE